MDDAKEFLASILKTVRDRFSNPLISAFVIAWVIWNFRVVLVLIGTGDGGWLAKIDYLDKRLMTQSWMWGVHGLVVPLLVSLAWIYILPPFLRKVASHHEGESGKTKAALLAAAEKAPISEEERDRLWSKLTSERRAWDLERSELLKVIDGWAVPNPREGKESEAPLPTQEPDHTENSGDVGRRTNSKAGAKISNDNDFFGLSALQKADYLGVRVRESPGVEITKDSSLRLTFAGLMVDWPWMPRRDRLPGLMTHVGDQVSGTMFTDVELWTMFRAREGGIIITGGDPSFEYQTSIEALISAGLAVYERRTINITGSGRIFLAWLLRVGFTFEELDTKGSPKSTPTPRSSSD